MSSLRRIEVVIPCYNYGHFLDQCLSAVTGQTLQDFSVLVIDNASEDDTPAIMSRWLKQDSRIRYLRNDTNLGLVGSMKKAYALTTAEYMAFLPADDFWLPGFLEQTAAALDAHPECTYAYTKWDVFFDDGSNSGTFPERPTWVPYQTSGVVEDMTCLLLQNWIPLSFGLFRRSACDRLGGMYPEDLPMLGDLLLWMRLSALGKSYFIAEQLGKLRKHGKNESNSLFISGQSAFEHIHVLDLVYQSDLWPKHLRLFAKVCQIRRLTGSSLCDVAFSFGQEGTLELIRDYVNSTRDELYVTVARCIITCLKSGTVVGTEEDATHLLNAALLINQGHREAQALLRLIQTLGDADYPTWIRNHGLNEVDAELFAERMILRWQLKPVFHLLLKLEEAEQLELLPESIESLSQSFYNEWRLTVVAPFACPDPIFHELSILRWIETSTTNEQAKLDALNEAVADSDAEWFILLPSGFRIEAHTFLRFGDYINLHPDWQLIYCDDDTVLATGERLDPRFKPDFNLDMLRSTDYIGPAFAHRRALALAGATAFMLPGAETHDLSLRILDAYGESALGHIADVLLHLPELEAVSTQDEAHKQAISQHLARCGVSNKVSRSYLPATFHVDYIHPAQDSVTIVVPSKNQTQLLKSCIDGLLSKTDYVNYDLIIIDNQSSDPETFDYYESLVTAYPNQVRIISYPHPFNYSAMCNQAAAEAHSNYLLFLNNDTEIMHPDWLAQMMAHAQRPEVGVVGARLLYPKTEKVQHAGVVLGGNLIASHPFSARCGINDPGYLNRALLEQNYSAVSGACQLVRKSIYQAIGGMDELKLTVCYNDIDLCLKVLASGFKVVWTPFATLIHHQSASLNKLEDDQETLQAGINRLSGEKETMLMRWLPILANDPAYNPNLSLIRDNMEIEHQIPLNWDTNFNDRQHILGTGTQGTQINQVLVALSQAGKAQCEFFAAPPGQTRSINVTEMARLSPDVFIINPDAADVDIANLVLYQRFLPKMKRCLVLNDRFITSSLHSLCLDQSNPPSHPFSTHLRKCLELADRLIVPNQQLANICRNVVDDIRIVPERLARHPWSTLVPLRHQGQKPRIGWVSAQRSSDDLALIEHVMQSLKEEVDWVIFGSCPEILRSYVTEVHALVATAEYPAKLASLNIDLGIDPLQITPKNEALSNRRLLEYGILGCPLVCSDVGPYRSNRAPITCVSNEIDSWLGAIRQKLADPEATTTEGLRLKQWVFAEFILEDHLDEWMSALSGDA